MQHETRDYDFVVVGGGMAGVCAAVAASRRGLRVALVHDRPVLGGNGSKELRVWLQGANGGRNNRYFRETGFLEELRLENLYRNPLG
ncbi:MAG: fumarate reductase/succinate dehydrogenase flavoprotein domain protein, partial [Armatimonadetes bacterium]|nr:fumarate reductase/succinate dehydrogenase flavoprotein domain protein [Armatimonadota bacterium]